MADFCGPDSFLVVKIHVAAAEDDEEEHRPQMCEHWCTVRNIMVFYWWFRG